MTYLIIVLSASQAATRSAALGIVAAINKKERLLKRNQKALLHYFNVPVQKNKTVR